MLAYPSNQFRRRVRSGKASFPAGDLWGLHVCVCWCMCVCWLAGIMDECCRNECAGSVLQGRSISTIHSSLITTAELKRDLSFSAPPFCSLLPSLLRLFFSLSFKFSSSFRHLFPLLIYLCLTRNLKCMYWYKWNQKCVCVSKCRSFFPNSPVLTCVIYEPQT